MSNKPKAEDQLENFANKQKEAPPLLTTQFGAPITDKRNALTAGPRGPQLIQDTVYIDEMSHFDRERIPERVVHAKGAGAFGYFECTHDVTKYTMLAPFASVGKRTDVAVRFSTVGGESGSADTARDPRGFAMKFYTEDGNWDLVGNNTPIFFIRDPLHFPSFIHTQKRNPQTHLKDANMHWDFASLRPETTHQMMFLFSDRGTPDGYRFMNGYGSHTFKLINKKGDCVYCKFHFKTDQGIKNLSAEKAAKLAGSDPDYSIRDLFNAIGAGDFPSWSLYLQIMTFEQAEKAPFNPFDLTKVWPQGVYPLLPVGRLVLNRNPTNYFAQVEQLAFAPAHMVPGVAASPDKMLQGRLFSYPDTHRHRLGANYLQIPVNRPVNLDKKCCFNYQRDGPMCVTANQDGAPNYFPNSFHGPTEASDSVNAKSSKEADWYQHAVLNDVCRYDSSDEDNFSQPRIFYQRVLDDMGRFRLVENLANHMKDALPMLRKRAIENFKKVDLDFGSRLELSISRLATKKEAKI